MELGCGCGKFAYPLEAEWFTGTYLGVDIDAEMIDFCRSHFQSPRFSFVLSEGCNRNYPSRKTRSRQPVLAEASTRDFIFSNSLFTHLLENEVRDYVTLVSRTLRPGGTSYMTFFAIEHVRKGDRWTFGHEIGNAHVENPDLPEAAVAYAADFLVSLFSEAGFDNVSVLPSRTQSAIVARLAKPRPN
jgi:cyclopropane fatty-acyl-phospholipid synthase-like methyltransferase